MGSWAFFFLTIIFMLTSRLTLSIKTSLKMGYELKMVFWTMNIKKGGITIHRGNGLGHPLLPTERVGGRLLRKISLRQKGFWFGGLGRSWSRRVRPVMAREWALKTFIWNIWDSRRGTYDKIKFPLLVIYEQSSAEATVVQ